MPIARKILKFEGSSVSSNGTGSVTITPKGTRNVNNKPQINVADSCGWFQIGNLIIQYGTYNTAGKTSTNAFTGNQLFEVNFAKSFPTKCLSVVASICEFDTALAHGNGPQIIATLEGWNNSKFVIMGDHTADGLIRASAFSYIAIGY